MVCLHILYLLSLRWRVFWNKISMNRTLPKTMRIIIVATMFYGLMRLVLFFTSFGRDKKLKFHKQFHIVWESGAATKTSQWIDPLRLLSSTLGLFSGKIELCRHGTFVLWHKMELVHKVLAALVTGAHATILYTEM